MGPAFLEVSERLPADGKQWMNSICCSACIHIFDFTYYTAFVSTHKLLHVYLSYYLPHPAWVEWASSCVVGWAAYQV